MSAAIEKELREALRAIVSEFNRDNIPAVQAAFNMVNIAQRALDSESCKHTGAVRWKDDWSGIEALSADFVRDEDHDERVRYTDAEPVEGRSMSNSPTDNMSELREALRR